MESKETEGVSFFQKAYAAYLVSILNAYDLYKSLLDFFAKLGKKKTGGNRGYSYNNVSDNSYQTDSGYVINDDTSETVSDLVSDESSEVSEEINTEINPINEEINTEINPINEENVVDTNPSNMNDLNIVDKIVDTNGNVVAIAVISDGIKKWFQVENGNVVIPADVIENYNLSKDIEITVDGVKTVIPSGNYKIDNIIYNADGTIKSVRIICGDYKLWLKLDSNGNIISTEYIRSQNGVFTIKNPDYKIIDMYGNEIGNFQNGDYFIYDVLYDSEGNPIAYRLSPDGEYEKWLYVNGNNTSGSASLFNTVQKNEKSNLSLFSENKTLFGLLGVLFVALGATLVVRKKVKDKENNQENNSDDIIFEDNSLSDDTLPTGNYAVYDVKKNDEGLVTEARINPLNESDEYWVEV